MFNPDVSHIFKTSGDGRYSDMDNSMDIMLNYDNNDLLSSEFFDTIRSVESGIQDDFLHSPIDDFNTLSDASSHTDGNLSPNDNSESERSSVEFTDESVSPLGTLDIIDGGSFFDFLSTPVDNRFEIQNTPVIINQQKPRKILIQNPNTKKILNKQIINATQLKKIGKSKVLKVQSLTANGKPILLPVKTIKVLNANQVKTEAIHVTTLPSSSVCRRRTDTIRIKEGHSSELTEVKLTSEEKRLLAKEGIQLPAYHPLTKLEDRELKRIRRKIRNKISAQDSRKRKKEYVDGLEERVRRGSEENRNLMQRVKELQQKNKTLMAHISKLQSLIFNTTSSKATPSTCLMIVMLSALLVSLPNIKLSQSNKELSTPEQEQVTVSRMLLSTQKTVDEDSLNMDEFFIFNKEEPSEYKYVEDNENNTNELFKSIEDMENKYNAFGFNEDNMFRSFVRNMKNLFGDNGVIGMHSDYGGFRNKKGFIEPDVDDFDAVTVSLEPPAKRMKLVDDHYRQRDENFVPNNVVSATVQTGAVGGRKFK